MHPIHQIRGGCELGGCSAPYRRRVNEGYWFLVSGALELGNLPPCMFRKLELAASVSRFLHVEESILLCADWS
jgi:hypothetical protein